MILTLNSFIQRHIQDIYPVSRNTQSQKNIKLMIQILSKNFLPWTMDHSQDFPFMHDCLCNIHVSNPWSTGMPSTNESFDSIMSKNWVFAKPLWGLIISSYEGLYEDNTEEIYEISIFNTYPPTLLCLMIYYHSYNW